ncbi:Protein SprT [Marinomonas spartinae]|uniref:Protein SprT n=1 Tax=Marinomonas spartinae TaxID=1792290 RepID=A0A1A8TM57_9GAMM|nr:SprT family zinc-dependent metalloprotease [Marinomonas spartinae]SBS33930.1 Protein SprT [Marinomonas spartinae]SBS37973.1 Protein SprT [Marinomonas spartinae]
MYAKSQLSFDMDSETYKSDVPKQALETIQRKVADCIDRANQFFGTEFKIPNVNLRQKGRAAGTAHLHKNEVRFNAYMYQQNPQDFLDTVVPHEVAHIIVFQIYGNDVRPHGREWQAVMNKVYGLPPQRTHNFDVPPPKHSYYYQCQCQTHTFTKQRHNRAQKGTEYICKQCRTKLYFIDALSNRY